MTDPHPPAAEPALPSDAQPPPPTAFAPADDGMLSIGKRWHGYRITAPIAGGPAGMFHAADAASMEGVVIRAVPLSTVTEWQRDTWTKLKELPPGRVAGLIDAREENGYRYEITQLPPGSTLRDWMSCHHADAATVEEFCRQMGTILHALHAQGIVHLHLRPDTVHVNVLDDGIEVVLGGLHHATLFDQPQLIAAEVDPFYAPPEAAGLFKHSPGPGLCAWDWWSLGRLAQEMILGKHVLGYFLDCDVTTGTPELRARAEALLLEKEPEGVRAGAIELMPELETMVRAILRGLLTASRDGRWKGEELRRRLAGESIRDHYDLAKNERLFVWRNRAYSLAEAVEFFTTDESWNDGEANLYAVPEDPTALINFLQEVPAYRAIGHRLKTMLALVDMPGWQDLPLASRRTAVAAVTWPTLAAPTEKAPLRVRGRRLDLAGLQELLGERAAPHTVGLLRALTTRPMIQRIESLDAAAARGLAQLASTAGEALQQAETRGLIIADDTRAQGKVFALALAPTKEIDDCVAQLRAEFASNRDPDLAEGLIAAKPERWMSVLLAYTAGSPAKFGYITHAERNLARHGELLEQGQRLAIAAFWQRLHRVLAAGPLLFGPWWLFTLVWTALAAAAWGTTRAIHWPQLAAIAILAVRLAAWLWLRVQVRRHDRTASPWTLRDRAVRCAHETQRQPPGLGGTSPEEISRQLREVSAELSQIVLSPPPARLLSPPRFVGLWLGVAASYAALLSAVGSAVLARENARTALNRAQALSSSPSTAAAAKPLQPPPGSPPGRYEEANDGFGRYLRGPLQEWDLPMPEIVPPLPVKRRLPATSQQTAYAVVSGELLLRPYPRQGLEAVLAVRVPVKDETGLMLYNSHDRKIVGRRVLLMQAPPSNHTWYQIDGHSVIYLGIPPSLEADLALPSP